MEIRYGLPMQALLLVFAALAAVRVFELVRDGWKRKKQRGTERPKQLREAGRSQT
jgi:hypothetical protein